MRALALCVVTAWWLAVSGMADGRMRTYSADPITFWVVDQETKQPIPGANVVAVWELEGGFNGYTIELFKVLEAVSDADGKVELPGWGPETRDVRGIIKGGAPYLYVFASGYRYDHAPNDNSLLKPAPSQTQSEWNGKRFPLKRNLSPIAEYAIQLAGQIEADFYTLANVDPCLIGAIPLFLQAIDNQNADFSQARVGREVFSGTRTLRERHALKCPEEKRR